MTKNYNSNIKIKDIIHKKYDINYNNTIFENLIKSNKHLIPKLSHMSLIFNINNTITSLVNAIRRTIIDELYIKILYFDLIDLYTNDKYILPDLIQNRIGLIPILQTINENISFNLYIKNDTLHIKNIYSNDIFTKHKNTYFNNNIILCQLHPNKILKIDNIKVKITQGYLNSISSIGNAMFEVIDFDMKQNLTLNSSPSNFKFTINSNGNINPIDILHLSIDNLIDRLNNITDIINNYDNDIHYNHIDLIITVQNNIKFYHINNESHTLGNLIVDYIYIIDSTITLLDYNVEHPTKNKVIITILHNDSNNLIKMAINNIIIDLLEIKKLIFLKN